MRKGRDGEKKGKKTGGKKKEKTDENTSLPAVDRPNADRWNATRSRQKNCESHYSRKRYENFYKGLQVNDNKSQVASCKYQMKCLKHVLTIHLSTNLNNFYHFEVS